MIDGQTRRETEKQTTDNRQTEKIPQRFVSVYDNALRADHHSDRRMQGRIDGRMDG